MTEFENLGSLITYKDYSKGKSVDCCLGYLFHSPAHGVFDPGLGKVPIPPEHVDAHNRALSEASINGLDNNCEIGQGSDFYLRSSRSQPGRIDICTWIGTVVGTGMLQGNMFEFSRKGRTFRGRKRKGDDCVFVKRIS